MPGRGCGDPRVPSLSHSLPLSHFPRRGKTTLLNVLAEGHPLETCPTIGLNVKRVKRGGVNLKCW